MPAAQLTQQQYVASHAAPSTIAKMHTACGGAKGYCGTLIPGLNGAERHGLEKLCT
eukprot:gene4078-23160_t